MYAVFAAAGRQYRAEIGAILDVDRLPYEVNQEIELADVLLVGDGDSTLIGQPLVEGASIKATVIDQIRGKKVLVFHYRQRNNLRRWNGHRQYYTRLRIDSINVK